MELSTRDVVARAIYTEVKEGRGSPHGGVFLDVSHLPPETVKKKLPSMYDQFLELAGVDITKAPMEIGPTCHYAMGGIKVDAETAASCVPGLYAAGECSGGMHGANRLGGNSLSDLLVFGTRAGAGAAAYAAEAGPQRVDPTEIEAAGRKLVGYLERPSGEDPYELHAELQATMQDLAGIFRRKEDLAAAVFRLEELEERAAELRVPEGGRVYNPAWDLCSELEHLLTCAQAVTRAALLREESRGAHSRLDFPAYDDFWGGHNIVVTKSDGRMHVEPAPVVSLPELEPLVAERKRLEAAA
jgi:succinate dehydrogenase / fumarate reductase flavoprotein subunit